MGKPVETSPLLVAAIFSFYVGSRECGLLVLLAIYITKKTMRLF